LGSEIQQALENLQGHSLVLVHDARTSRIPWETLSIRGWQPALRTGLVRRYLAENLSVAKWLEERRFERALNILLVADPTLDLPGAEEERRRLVRLFSDNPFIRLTVRSGREATKPVLYADFRSGAFDVLHYAGHAHFDSQRPASSGILCADGQVLSGRDLAGLSKLPALVFFNACESGRLRSSYAKDKRKLDIEDRIERNVSLAEAFLRGGVANYIGTFWPVQDASAKRFGLLFYEQLLSGATLGEAILKGRNALENLPSVDWADYILYGSPDFVLKETAGPRSGAVHS
jgi:CHAT domain-containing protein